ncbi:MAG: phage portal protein [Deferribacterales bacterium]
MKLTDMKIIDSIQSMFNSLLNRRNPLLTNRPKHIKLDDTVLNSLYLSGLGQAILDHKVGGALKNTLNFAEKSDEIIYDKKLKEAVKEACRYQIAFGRGVICIVEHDKSISSPISGKIDLKRTSFRVFSGQDVSVSSYGMDITDERFYKPKMYMVYGNQFHHSRVIDFAYKKPVFQDLPQYNFGGVSEFEIIYEQLINDGIVQRSSATMVEKGARTYYKVKGFKSLLASKQDAALLQYFSAVEDYASVSTATIIDAEDEITPISLKLQHLKEIAEDSLRRVAAVTRIPVSRLVGENVKGLNSTGDNEDKMFWEGIADYQESYIYCPLNELFSKCGLGEVWFKEALGVTATQQMDYDGKALDNAAKMTEQGYTKEAKEYLEDKGVIKIDTYKKLLNQQKSEKEMNMPETPEIAANHNNLGNTQGVE